MSVDDFYGPKSPNKFTICMSLIRLFYYSPRHYDPNKVKLEESARDLMMWDQNMLLFLEKMRTLFFYLQKYKKNRKIGKKIIDIFFYL
jgi:hypothetical protein